MGTSKSGTRSRSKAAPDLVLDLCGYYQQMDDHIAPLDEDLRMRILAANDALTQDALRVLGVAISLFGTTRGDGCRGLEKDLVFVGLIGMIDPPRPEVIPALETARRAGMRTVMITGDFPQTARAIAESIHLSNRVTRYSPDRN